MRASIFYLLVLPPPVSGHTLINASMLSALSERGHDIEGVDISGGEKRSRFRKLMKLFQVLPFVFRRGASRKTLYYVYHAKAGILINLWVALLARFRFERSVFHHHSYAYLNRKSAFLKLFCVVSGPNVRHIFLSKKMAEKASSIYSSGTFQKIVVIENTKFAFLRRPMRSRRSEALDLPRENSTLVFGHISNLTFEKGLDTLLLAFEKAAQVLNESDVSAPRLFLAGAASTALEKTFIEKYIGYDWLVYLGPLFDKQKDHFFESIDVLLFPTRYQGEAQPLVLIEAMNAGVGVVSTGMGAIEELVGDGGVLLGRDDVAGALADLVVRLVSDPREVDELKCRSRGRASQLARDSQNKLAGLLGECFD